MQSENEFTSILNRQMLFIFSHSSNDCKQNVYTITLDVEYNRHWNTN